MRQIEQIVWTPVGEGLPIVRNELYLVSNEVSRPAVAYLDERGKWSHADNNRLYRFVTAWANMPNGYDPERR